LQKAVGRVRSPRTGPGLVAWCVWAALLAGCGPPASRPPQNDTLTLTFSSTPLSAANLTVQSATLALSGIVVFGDTSSAMGRDQDRPVLDIVAAGAADVHVEELPPGVYSRVSFNADNMMLRGSWRGTPLQIDVGEFGGGMVALRSRAGQDVGGSNGAHFDIVADPNAWFAGNILDQAMIVDGQIRCDLRANGDVAGALINRIAGSFSIH
jgi:hypothetical protein